MDNHHLNVHKCTEKKLNLVSLRSVWFSAAAASAVIWRRDSGNPLTSSGFVKTNEKAFVASNTLLLKKKQYHCKINWPKHFKIDYIHILLCRVTASLSSTAPLWNCHTTSAISLNIFIQTKFHYNMPICQVLLNNKISAVYAETNRNIQPPLKKIAFTPNMAGLIESLMFEKQTSKKPDIDKIIYYQRTKKTHKTTKMYDTWEKCKGLLHKGNKTLSKEKRQLHNISLRLISWIKSFWSIRTHSSPSNVQSKHCNKTTSRCTVRSLVGAQLSDRDTSLL